MSTVIPNRYGVYKASLTGPGNAADDSTVTVGLWRRPGVLVADATWSAIFDRANDAFTIFLSGSLYSGWAFVKGTLTYREGGDLFSIEENFNVTGVAGTPAPAYTSLVCRKNTGFVGRKFQGRMSFPGCLENAAGVLPDGSINPVSLPFFATRFNTLHANLRMATLDSPTMEPVILHSDATTPTVITSFSPSPLPGINKTRYR
jgi:hypothetical protein